MKHNEKFLTLVEDVRKNVQETNVETIHARMEQGDRFHFIDTREDHEWQKGHLPNAVHLGRGILERDIETRIPDFDTEIVLYCGGGFRSALAADNLQKMGYTNVWSMDGGFRGWQEAGFEILFP